nr:MAG TPA: hypothetical protein [Caudoviricetes sp.]
MEKETNLEHYKERLKRILKMKYKDPQTVFHDIKAYIDPEIQRTSDFFTSSILDWMAQEYKPELLDKVEKKYLSEVIRPFRKEVTTIKKIEAPAGREYISILLKDDGMCLPCFKKDTMYKGLELEKGYTPEELGL